MADKPEELTEQKVMIHGMEHTMLLNQEDAERYKAEEESWKAQGGDASEGDDSDPDSKAKSPSNKARSAESK